MKQLSVSILLLSLIASLVLFGCGVKGDPLPILKPTSIGRSKIEQPNAAHKKSEKNAENNKDKKDE